MEVAPAAGAEARRQRHVGHRRVADAVVELREVHHLEQRVEHARAALGRLGRRGLLARPRGQRLAAHEVDRDGHVGPVLDRRARRHGHERQAVDEPLRAALVGREHPGQRGRGEQRLPERALADRRRLAGREVDGHHGERDLHVGERRVAGRLAEDRASPSPARSRCPTARA